MYPYQGLRPHAEAASKGTPADPNRVMQDSTLGRLGHLLSAAVAHTNAGRFDAGRSTYEAAEVHLHELRAVLAAGESAYAEVGPVCNPPPPMECPPEGGVDPPINPDNVGVDDSDDPNPDNVGVEPDPPSVLPDDLGGPTPTMSGLIPPEEEPAEKPKGRRR